MARFHVCPGQHPENLESETEVLHLESRDLWTGWTGWMTIPNPLAGGGGVVIAGLRLYVIGLFS